MRQDFNIDFLLLGAMETINKIILTIQLSAKESQRIATTTPIGFGACQN